MPDNPGDFAVESAEALLKLKEELDSCINDSCKDHLNMDQEDAQLMQQSIRFISCPEETYLIILAVHRDPRKNKLSRIKCHKGVPLGGYAYDNVNEAYCANCSDHLALGLVPISFQAKLNNWAFYVPLPESMIMKYLSPEQKSNLESYKSKFPEGEFTFDFLQLLN